MHSLSSLFWIYSFGYDNFVTFFMSNFRAWNPIAIVFLLKQEGVDNDLVYSGGLLLNKVWCDRKNVLIFQKFFHILIFFIWVAKQCCFMCLLVLRGSGCNWPCQSHTVPSPSLSTSPLSTPGSTPLGVLLSLFWSMDNNDLFTYCTYTLFSMEK